MKKTQKLNSIGFRLAVIFVCAVLVQCLIMGILLIVGGVIKETEMNAYGYFSSQVNSRADHFESQKQLIWTDFADLPEEIEQVAAKYRAEVPKNQQTPDGLLHAVAPQMVDLIKRTKTTGAFLILPKQEDTLDYNALYLRNMNPNQKGENSYNLTLKAGPLDLKKKFAFATSDKWKYRLPLNETNEAIFQKPFSNIHIDADKRALSYWSEPFSLDGDMEASIAYAMPMKDSDGEVLGVLGIELSVSYIQSFLPKKDLVGDSNLGFILGKRNEEGGAIFPVATKAGLHDTVLHLEQPLELAEREKGLGIYEITNAKGEAPLMACVEPLQMYRGNTTFSKEEWFLVGLMEEKHLLEFSHRISDIMLWSFVITFILGIIVAVLATRKFSKPIVCLAEEVRNLNGENGAGERTLRQTGLYEIDQLSEAILTTQQEMQALNDRLKYERDRDAMTQIQNRHAFHQQMELLEENRHVYDSICIGLFDLNGLKAVNDTFGHEAGDRYICDSVKLIGGVFSERLIYRIGGDEFALLVTDSTPETIEAKHQRLLASVSDYNRQSEFQAGIAFGYVFTKIGDTTSLNQLLKEADEMMYKAKKQMKNHRASLNF